MILGASVLASYMICIVFIHMYKEKPFEVVVLIVVATIFATFLGRPDYFVRDENHRGSGPRLS